VGSLRLAVIYCGKPQAAQWVAVNPLQVYAVSAKPSVDLLEVSTKPLGSRSGLTGA